MSKELITHIPSLQIPAKQNWSSGVIFQAGNDVLIMKPHDRPWWIWSGGMGDPRESAKKAARREVREELGETIGDLVLRDNLALAYTNLESFNPKIFVPSMHFVFRYVIEPEDRRDFENSIKPQADEIKELGFVPVEDAIDMLHHISGKAYKSYLDNGQRLLSLTNGLPIGARDMSAVFDPPNAPSLHAHLKI